MKDERDPRNENEALNDGTAMLKDEVKDGHDQRNGNESLGDGTERLNVNELDHGIESKGGETDWKSGNVNEWKGDETEKNANALGYGNE